MARIIVVFSICFAAPLGFAQERYYDDIGRFSFDVPGGWEYFYEDELGDEYREQLKETYPGRAMVMLVETGGQFFEPSYIVITIEGVKKPKPKGFIEDQVAGDWRQYVLSEDKSWLALEKRVTDLQEAKGCLPQHWSGAELVKSEVKYYPERHMIRETVELYKEGVGNIVCYTSKLQGSYRITTLYCYGDDEGEGLVGLASTMWAIENTFEYDEGYGYEGEEGKGQFPVAGQEESLNAASFGAKIVGTFIWAVLYAICLWMGVKYWGEPASFAKLVFIAFVSALLGQVRFMYLGYPLSIISMYVLLCKLLDDVDLVGAAVIVTIANCITWFVGSVALAVLLENFPGIAM